MTDSHELTRACNALIDRAIRLCKRAGWGATADGLHSDALQAVGDLRELLIVRDCAEHALACLAANGFEA